MSDPRKTTKAFLVNSGRGFRLNLPNDITASVVFGPGTYSDNYSMDFTALINKTYPEFIDSDKVEIAFMRTSTSEWMTREIMVAANMEPTNDDVYGYATIDEVLTLIEEARRYRGKSLFVREEV